jgi:hypothetical protein
MHAELPGFIAGGRYHAPVGVSRHEDAFAFQFRVVMLLHRCEKGIHVDVQDHGFFYHENAFGQI